MTDSTEAYDAAFKGCVNTYGALRNLDADHELLTEAPMGAYDPDFIRRFWDHEDDWQSYPVREAMVVALNNCQRDMQKVIEMLRNKKK